MGLSAAQKQDFAKNGFLVIDPGLPCSVLDGIVSDLSGVYGNGKGHDLSYCDERRIQDAWRISENVLTAATSPTVISALEDLYERKPMPFQTLNFRVGSEQRPHADTIHFNSEPSGFMCGVWLALEDIDENNGPLVYYPGSHMLPEITFKDVGVRPHHTNYTKYEDFVEEIVENKVEAMLSKTMMKPQYGKIRKGQAIIWSANLIHGGAPQKDRARTRHSLVTHFYFENCSYWSPMHSNDNFTYRRYPVWVQRGNTSRRKIPMAINGLRWRLARLLHWI